MPDHRLPRGLEQVRLLGSGGFGYVVLARDPNLGREVAVKYVYGGAHAGDSRQRMAREARALAALDHPGVLRVYELVDIGADVALILEYAEGGDLKEALRTRYLDLATRFDLLAQVAAAVEAVHAIGVVHRDLKPANILLTAQGRVRIADFGLARLTADAAAFRTDAGVVAGTPHYAPPEQFAGIGLESPRLDWYSYAVVAHLVLLGELPRSGEVAPEFEDALALDPGRRLAPSDLLTRLRGLPEHRWPRLLPTAAAPSQDAATGAAPDPDATSASPPTSSPWGRGASAAQVRPPDADATVVAPRPDGWVDVPVFRAVPARRSLPLVPVLVGLGLGLLAVVIVLVAR